MVWATEAVGSCVSPIWCLGLEVTVQGVFSEQKAGKSSSYISVWQVIKEAS